VLTEILRVPPNFKSGGSRWNHLGRASAGYLFRSAGNRGTITL
jgi:hypothetical protein